MELEEKAFEYYNIFDNMSFWITYSLYEGTTRMKMMG